LFRAADHTIPSGNREVISPEFLRGIQILLPELFVEGSDDTSVISALLKRHGVDTKRGDQHLKIKHQKDDGTPGSGLTILLDNMPDAIRNATNRPVGFVLDIDIEIANRWSAVCGKLSAAGITPPPTCPSTGFFARLPNYPHQFGVWLMPDCVTDNLKMEHLCESMITDGNPLWAFAQASVANAEKLVDEANVTISEEHRRWKRFRDVDRIKAEIHTWLSWQSNPGSPLGTAINARILGFDSPQAIAFLRWLRDLYGFSQLTGI
jgi:hypothetical protein